MVSYSSSMAFNSAFGSHMSFSGKGSVVPSDPLKAIELIKSGISKGSLDQLIASTGLSSLEMSAYMHVSERTLRNYTESTLLNPEMTERALEIAQLYERGTEVFGSLVVFQKYMNSAIIALGGKMPKEFLDTSMGIQFLLNELGRIEHGILA